MNDQCLFRTDNLTILSDGSGVGRVYLNAVAESGKPVTLSIGQNAYAQINAAVLRYAQMVRAEANRNATLARMLSVRGQQHQRRRRGLS